MVVQAIVRKPTSPRRWEERRFSGTRSIGRKGASDPPLAVQVEGDVDGGFARASADNQPAWPVLAPTQFGIVQDGVWRPRELRKSAGPDSWRILSNVYAKANFFVERDAIPLLNVNSLRRALEHFPAPASGSVVLTQDMLK